MPEYEEDYYTISFDGKTISWDRWLDDAVDLAMYKCGWIFKTKEEAEHKPGQAGTRRDEEKGEGK